MKPAESEEKGRQKEGKGVKKERDAPAKDIGLPQERAERNTDDESRDGHGRREAKGLQEQDEGG